MDGELKHAEITELIIKAFYRVYNALGYGFLEKVYVNALLIELYTLGLRARKEAAIEVYYEGQVVGHYSADVLVNELVIVEAKSAEAIAESHEAQLTNYLKSTRYEVGLLLNFGPKPQVKRKVFDNANKGNLSWLKK